MTSEDVTRLKDLIIYKKRDTERFKRGFLSHVDRNLKTKRITEEEAKDIIENLSVT